LARASTIAKSYLSDALNGRHKLSQKALTKMAPHLPLSENEFEYLRLLCQLSEAESQNEKIKVLQQIQKISSYRKHNPKENEVYNYLSHWHYVIIREMAELPNFRLDPKWIQKQLWETVSLADIESGIEFLLTNGFLEKTPEGGARLPVKRLDCLDQIHKAALLQFYRQIYSLATETVEKVDTSQKNMTGYTVAISFQKFAEIKKILEESLEKILALADAETKPEAVFHFNLLGFPLTKGETK
jgi:uncharacterized protein (TIGR02147 family)